jgi:ABC-type transport system involved in multi-copper enzyme maturation permease subunit
VTLGLLMLALTFIFPIMIVYYAFFDPYPGAPPVGSSAFWRRFHEQMNVWVRGATGIIGALLMLGAAVRGAGSVSGERDKDTWVSLLTTPLTSWQILWGKWCGCTLGQRQLAFVLLLVWATGLVSGGLHVGAVPLLALCLVVYLTAFAWVGLFFSVTARTSLLASVRAIFASLFLIGGFWIAFGLCCAMPLSFTGGSRDVVEGLAQILMGVTPPFVFGWAAVWDFDRYWMEPFYHEGSTVRGLGPLSPFVGLAVWAGFALILAKATTAKFRQVSNRANPGAE